MSAATAAGMSGGHERARASAPRPAVLGLAPLGFLEVPPPALVDVAARAGFGSVTLRTRAAVPGGIEYPLPPESRLRTDTLARIRDTGVAVLQVELIALSRETDIAGCRSMLEDGAALGATRVVASGDDPDDRVLAEQLAALCELAAGYRMTVDLEFMPFRHLAKLRQALAVVAMSGADNARVMIDALHLFRSGGTVAEVAAAPPGSLGVCQLCDAPAAAPAQEALAAEARERRLLPGDGELPLRALLEALPVGVLLAAEVPFALQFPQLSPLDRAMQVYRATADLVSRSR